MNSDHDPDAPRLVHRIVIDVLATEAQVPAIERELMSTLCASSLDHNGPCRIAWQVHRSQEYADGDQDGAGLNPDEIREIRDELHPIEVWPQVAVDRSLGVHHDH